MKIAIVLGTRPEIIKMSPIIRELDRSGLNYFVLHSGQHYSYSMDQVFFEQLRLPGAKYNLDVGSGSHGKQTGKMLTGIEKILLKEIPDVVLVQGDTNTVLAGALAASKLNVPVGHVEAGLRSFDRSMPEEINRVVADHTSDLLFAPTEFSKKCLLNEGIPEEKIFVTGNTVVDAVNQNLELSKDSFEILDKLGLKEKNYFLVTLHRQENVDRKEKIASIVKSLQEIKFLLGLELVYPIHPRTRKCLKNFGIGLDGIRCVDPLDYLSFLYLESQARLVLTDSGGVQEETCILKVPCVTLRENTERPETIKVGSNILAGTSPERVLEMIEKMMKVSRNWVNPLGDGSSGKQIIQILREYFE
ncbi:MAG: UDP-N-acetylglucosamine 2-epimerase (non-hydrolyzing) [Candidatus Bathyarchaeota archaeon]|nr:UDP-N-acetylglucosamine 2-epimerase (non-hydrolyzing) [Candidatus Bathyarchaeum tardum]